MKLLNGQIAKLRSRPAGCSGTCAEVPSMHRSGWSALYRQIGSFFLIYYGYFTEMIIFTVRFNLIFNKSNQSLGS